MFARTAGRFMIYVDGHTRGSPLKVPYFNLLSTEHKKWPVPCTCLGWNIVGANPNFQQLMIQILHDEFIIVDAISRTIWFPRYTAFASISAARLASLVISLGWLKWVLT